MIVKMDDIELHGDYAKIIFKDKNNSQKGVGYIDLDDINKILNKHINLMSNGYVCIKTSERTNIGLHRFIMGVTEKDLEVDHINGDRSDNRKPNLRICTTSQNFMNRSKYNCNKSGHRGVYWNKHIPNPKWVAYITINKKRKHLGYFDNLEDRIRF